MSTNQSDTNQLTRALERNVDLSNGLDETTKELTRANEKIAVLEKKLQWAKKALEERVERCVVLGDQLNELHDRLLKAKYPPKETPFNANLQPPKPEATEAEMMAAFIKASNQETSGLQSDGRIKILRGIQTDMAKDAFALTEMPFSKATLDEMFSKTLATIAAFAYVMMDDIQSREHQDEHSPEQ